MIFRPLQIQDIRKETAECVSIAFSVPEEWKHEFLFKQGQNITVKIVVEGEEIRRSYSICSSPLENELRVAVKKADAGKFSNLANTSLKKGDILEVLPPTGNFLTELNAGQALNYLAFAAGSGITPVISIIKTTLATELKSSFTLVYGNRNISSIIFREELEAIKNKYMQRFRVNHILSREETDAPINHGRINREKCVELMRLIDFTSIDEFFICGPEKMISDVKEFLELQHIKKTNIHFELFHTPGQAQIKSQEKQWNVGDQFQGRVSNVSIRVDGRSFETVLPYNSASILNAALQQGIDLPFACKGGVCSTCRAKLIEGKVEMDVNYALETDEIEAGFILTCQAHPRSEKVVVDFDVK